MTKALFICGKARMRSPTAADVCAQWDGVQTDFAGLSNDADERVSTEHLEWADIIFVMERRQKTRLTQLFSKELRDKKVICLNIPDKFDHMQAELVTLIETKLRKALP